MEDRSNVQKVIIVEAQGRGYKSLMGSTLVWAGNFP